MEKTSTREILHQKQIMNKTNLTKILIQKKKIVKRCIKKQKMFK